MEHEKIIQWHVVFLVNYQFLFPKLTSSSFRYFVSLSLLFLSLRGGGLHDLSAVFGAQAGDLRADKRWLCKQLDAGGGGGRVLFRFYSFFIFPSLYYVLVFGMPMANNS